MVFVISSINFMRFWWHLVYGLLSKFAANWCKRFPPHRNNISTLRCETWNAHHTGATTALSDTETPDFIPPQLWPPNSPDLNPVDYSVWRLLQEKLYKIRIIDVDELKQRLRSEWAKQDNVVNCGSHSSVASSIAPVSRSAIRVLYTFSCNSLHTL